jgi:hypothetical protein
VQSFTQGTWGNPSPNACDYHSWNTWPLWGLTSHSLWPVPCLTIFPYHHEALICISPIFVCYNICSHYILFLGDSTFGITFMVWRAFVLHALHHLHQTLIEVQNVSLLVHNPLNPKL